MTDLSRIDYSHLDRPEFLAFLFYPRPEFDVAWARSTHHEDVLIPVDEGVVVGARFHLAGDKGPNVLFFHGNGEIVADYDDLADVYTRLGINFYPVDYRGYGRSTGTPTITAMMRDAHVVFRYWKDWLKEKGYRGPAVVMGRSLGSAPALELISAYADEIGALIIESGFAYSEALVRLLGFRMRDLGLTEEDGFRNIDKIRAFSGPTLIIHAEFDHILPFSEGQALYDASPAADKRLLKIPGANHNDIIMKGFREYIDAVREYAEKAKG
ncbi:MAG TPA: alpha/beta hydrolase [Syntrophales bacterium]|nr:alpha/beta hydrolase [Syntrophobacterales bacterium]HRR42749.1 alpha/beta hydrolase [Syntrophales bacterium]